MLKSCILLLLILISFETFSTGIMAPAGLGYALLIILVIIIIGIYGIGFIVKIIYNNSSNKARTRNIIIFFFSIIFVFFAWINGYISFTKYTVIDNNPLENTLQVNQLYGYSFKLSDGNSYEFINNHYYSLSRSEYYRMEVGRSIMLEDKNNGEYNLLSIGKSSAFYEYQRNAKKIALTLPLSFKNINMNARYHEGIIHRITENWTANDLTLTMALFGDYCCDMQWIKNILNHNVNNAQPINNRKLLHFVFQLKIKKYKEFRFEILDLLLTQENVDINQKSYFSETILHKAIEKIDDNEFDQSDKIFMQMLLNAGVDQNLSDKKNVTPLIYAINNHSFKLAQFLLLNGADFNKKFANNESAMDLVKRTIAEDKTRKDVDNFQGIETNLAELLSRMNNISLDLSKKNDNLNKITQMNQVKFPSLSTITHDCNKLGNLWGNSYGIKVDNITDLSTLSEQEKNQVKSLQKPFQKLGIIALADYTCIHKQAPVNTVTVKVFVFKNKKLASDWWHKKYQYEGWEKHYTKSIDTSYASVDSKQLSKRALLVKNIWITTHHLKTGNEHLILLDDILKNIQY